MAYANIDQRASLSPGAMAATVAINGAVFAALILIPATVARVIDHPIIEVFPTTPDRVPPPPPDADNVTKVAKDSPVYIPKPLVPLTPPSGNGVTTTDKPTIGLGAGGLDDFIDGNAGGGSIPAAHEPVFIGPRFDPRYADRLQPPYPDRLLRQGIEGMVTLRVLVGPDGRVIRTEEISATDPAFWAASERHALRSWRFLPATRDGEKVEGWHQLTLKFEIN